MLHRTKTIYRIKIKSVASGEEWNGTRTWPTFKEAQKDAITQNLEFSFNAHWVVEEEVCTECERLFNNK